MQTILLSVVSIIVAAYVFSQVAKMLKLPAVLGQLAAGFLLAVPVINQMFFTSESIPLFEFLSEVGILLMFFLAGLTLKFENIDKEFKAMILSSLLGSMIPLLLGFLAAFFLFRLDFSQALFAGMSIAVSSQAISYRIIEETGMTKHKIAAFIEGSSMIDDMIEFILLSLMLAFFGVLLTSLTQMLIGIVAFVVIVLICKFYFIHALLEKVASEHSQATYLMATIVAVLLMAYIADLFGISAFLAAMITGIIMRQILAKLHELSTIGRNISSTVHTTANGFFIPIFFVWAGMNTGINSIGEGEILLIITLAALDIFGTSVGTVIGMLSFGKKLEDAVIVSLGVLPKGDTELALAAIALHAGIIGKTLYSSIIVMAFIVTIISSIAFRHMLNIKKAENSHNNNQGK